VIFNEKRGVSMKKRFREAVDDIDYEDLVKIKNDLETGGQHIKKLVTEKIDEIEREEVKACATCGNPINPHYVDDYSLIFGRFDFKKRAYFCGLDCLSYFLEGLKEKEKSRLGLEKI
jgi:hypothetical protein